MSCGDGGILGPVVGVMGVLQAVEAVRYVAAGKLDVKSEVGSVRGEPTSMLLFSAHSAQPFRSVKLRSRRKGCFACSKEGQLSLQSLSSGSLDYVLFCGLTSPVNILKPEERVEAKEYAKIKGKEHLLLDVREKVQFDICALPGSINIPFSIFQGKGAGQCLLPKDLPDDTPIYIVCRLGNDSQVVTKKLKDSKLDSGSGRYIGDIKGGLRAWKEQVDPSWPEY